MTTPLADAEREHYVAQASPDPTIDDAIRCRQCNGWGCVYVAAGVSIVPRRCGFCRGAGEVDRATTDEAGQ